VPEASKVPISYLHGHGEMFSGLEKALEGAKSGEREEVVIPPAEGYGERDENGVVLLPSSRGGAPCNARPGTVD
jgi:FKBP-type peptidyl-prolyl cis-trans isomerase SlyD